MPRWHAGSQVQGNLLAFPSRRPKGPQAHQVGFAGVKPASCDGLVQAAQAAVLHDQQRHKATCSAAEGIAACAPGATASAAAANAAAGIVTAATAAA